MPLILLFAGGLIALLATPLVGAQPRPVTRAAVRDFAPLDRAVLDFMDRIDAQAATVAVSREGKLLYSRGYGWSDAHKKKPTAPDAILRVAGLTQRITAVAVKKLIQDGKLSLDTKVFRSLNFKPPKGAVPDPRLFQITVGQLLEYQGGWDAQMTFDPFTRLREIQKSLHLSHRPHPNDVIRYMLGQPLQFDPGKRTAPSNFGFSVLGRVIEKASGETYEKYVCPGSVIRAKSGTRSKTCSWKSPTRTAAWSPRPLRFANSSTLIGPTAIRAARPTTCSFPIRETLRGRRPSSVSGPTVTTSPCSSTAVATRRGKRKTTAHWNKPSTTRSIELRPQQACVRLLEALTSMATGQKSRSRSAAHDGSI
jgi:hypothetical protein